MVILGDNNRLAQSLSESPYDQDENLSERSKHVGQMSFLLLLNQSTQN